ncbi:MAG: 2OG-Fe(II) oxygenase family protein [Alphaproteobacteria bacterium]
MFRDEYEHGSRLARETHGQKTFRYDTARYPFAAEMTRLLVEKGLLSGAAVSSPPPLERLHEVLSPDVMALDAGELNDVSRRFYDTDEGFTRVYESFLAEVVGPMVVDGEFVFQTTPTIRFHFPHQAGFKWRPRYHTDVMLGHPPQEINLWLPVAGALGSASMRIAPMEKSVALCKRLELDFERLARGVQEDVALAGQCETMSEPVDLSYGQFLAFDSRCLHATQYNDTNWTRISLDFRAVPLEEYEAIRLPYRGTGRRQMLFRRGEYYDSRTSRDLSSRPG